MLGLDVTALPPGTHTRTLTPAAEDLNLDPAAFEAIVVEVHLDHQPDRTLVAFTVQAKATLECDRTLQLFQQPVSGSYTVLFVPPERLAEYGADEDDSDENVQPLPEPGEELDLTAPVRDTLLLALPTRRIAPGAEDEDIPLSFGVTTDEEGAPMDPRWDALRKLRDSSD